MDNIWAVIGLALLPALGNFGGGILAEFLAAPPQRINKALHASAGIMTAVVAVELVPEALDRIPVWIIALAFGLGGLAYIGIEEVTEKLQRGQTTAKTGMWMVYMAVAIDLFSDGLLIGTGSAVSFSMALVLSLGQLLADVPEGYAAIANMKGNGIPKKRRMLLSALLVVPILVSGILSYYLLRGQSDVLQMGVLMFTAGLLSVAAVEDMISEAHESAEDNHWSALSYTGGFVLFTLLSAGLGGV